jgi:hypothetical protein
MPITINGSGTVAGITAGGLPDGIITLAELSATGTASSSTFLRGDNSWNTPSSIGVGQTWSNVTASRVAGTTYTNSTALPIQVCIWQGNTSLYYFTINGTNMGVISSPSGTWGFGDVFFIVPVGATYSITAPSFYFWSELR